MHALRDISTNYLRKDEKLLRGRESVEAFLKNLYEITKAECEAWDKIPRDQNKLNSIKSALDSEADISKSKNENLMVRIRNDARVLLDTWDRTSKYLQ